MKIARRLQLDIREDGEAIITSVPSTRFDDPPHVMKRGTADGFVLDVEVGARTFTIDIESEETPKGDE
jgi:hypothetical protein